MVLRAPDGRVWVGDRGGNQVLSISDAGQVQAQAGDPNASTYQDGASALQAALLEPRAIWPFLGGWFIGLHGGNKVVYLDDRGTTHLFLDGGAGAHAGDGEPFDTPGAKINEVRSLTLSMGGDMIIVESDAGYVRVVKAR